MSRQENDTIYRQETTKHLKHRLYETAMNNPDLAGVFFEIADNRVETWIKELPSAQPEKRTEERTETHACDCISRQDAIRIVDGIDTWQAGWRGDAIESMKALPSAQPEIVRCKECRHRDPEDHKCDCGHDIIWQLPRDDKWYCADAERRTDE